MSLTFPPMNNQAKIITKVNSNILVTLISPSTITTTAIPSASGMVCINPTPAISVAATDDKTQILKLGWMLWKMPFSNWGVCWRSSFQKAILRVGHEEKIIGDIWLISQLMLPNLKLTSPLTKRVTGTHLLKRNPAQTLWMLMSAGHQRMYLIKTFIRWFQMQESRINQIRWAVQQKV